VTPKSGILLLGSCIAGISSVGSIFELAYGNPDLGTLNTSIILAVSIPLTVILFLVAVQDTKANYK
jgi:hypothetical protein